LIRVIRDPSNVDPRDPRPVKPLIRVIRDPSNIAPRYRDRSDPGCGTIRASLSIIHV